MRIAFRDLRLERSYLTGVNHARLGTNVFKSFVEKVAFIASAPDEKTLYNTKSLHYELLKGDRVGQRSIRLNKQFRLVFTIEQDDEGKFVWIIEVVDYH